MNPSLGINVMVSILKTTFSDEMSKEKILYCTTCSEVPSLAPPIVIASRVSGHGLSQQGIWELFGHPNPLKSCSRTPKIYCEEFKKKNVNFQQILECFDSQDIA